MSDSVDTDTLIIGAGFAGLSVAERLRSQDITIVDRGEPFDAAAARTRFREPTWQHQMGEFGPWVEAEARVMQSADTKNRAALPLSIMSVNVYSYAQGGISNWWGGYAKRVTAACFEQDGELAWPIGLADLVSYYGEAERALRVHGDPLRVDATVFGAMPGWDLWRGYLGGLFPGAHVTSEAKNLSDHSGETAIGLCTGNGHCTICSNDAKARPATVFPSLNVYSRTIVRELMFTGARAVAARCCSDGEEYLVHFNRVVVAAGGLENAALLRRSKLPLAVPRHLIGRWYQDHTAAEILVEMPEQVPYFQIGAECHVELPDMSGYYQGLEIKVLFLTVPPNDHMTERLRRPSTIGETLNLKQTRNRLGRIYLQIEVPPEWNLRIRSRGDESYLYTMPYFEKLAVIDRALIEIQQRLVDKGLRLHAVFPYYRRAFGGHHYSGVTPMSRTANRVVDCDQLLLGTNNVYLNGASVMPRCGGAGPTLSIVALGFRLGDHLAER